MMYRTLGGHLTAYRYRAGNGPAVVLVNSLGSTQSLWDDVIAALGSQRAILTYDLRGHGASGAPAGPYSIAMLADDLVALIDALDLSGILVVGVSIGGLVAQAAALKRPDLLRGLVLSNTAARIGTAERWSTRIAEVEAGGMAAIADAAMDLWFAPDFAISRPDDWAGYRRMLLGNDPAGYVAACAALRDGDLTGEVSRITAPTLCLTGSEDRSVPPATTAALSGAIPGSHLVTLPGSGHLPCIDAPRAVAAAIDRLIAETAPALDRHAAGMAVRRAVLGDAHVDRADAATTEFDAAFQALITEGAWGRVWASDAISRRERSMLTLALLAALGNTDEIPMHIRATARTGASPSDVREAFQHVAIYAGVPRANRALAIARDTYAAMEALRDD